MTEREFWVLIRRALLMVCKAIERRYIEPDLTPVTKNDILVAE